MIAQRRAAGLDGVVEHRPDGSTSARARSFGAPERVAMVEARRLRRQRARDAAPRRHRCCRAPPPRADPSSAAFRLSSCRRRRAPASRRRMRCRAAPGPSARSSGSSSSLARGTSFIEPNRRGSLKVTRAPFDMWNTTWSCARVLRARVMDTRRASCVVRRRATRGTSPTCRDASAARRRRTDRRADISRGGRARVTVWPSSRFDEILRQRPAQVGRGAPRPCRSARPPSPAQAAAHGLDFGQFGHAVINPAAARMRR